MGWLVLGAVNVDVEAVVPSDICASDGDYDGWVEWAVGAGGTGGNMASHLAHLGVDLRFVAVVGDDSLGALAIDLLCESSHLGREMVKVQRVGGAVSGVVVLGRVGSREGRRVLLGPSRSAVDAVRLADLDLTWADPRDWSDVLLDGYLLFRQREGWLQDMEAFADDGRSVHVELVPHGYWGSVPLKDFERTVALSRTVSANLSTLENLLGLPVRRDSHPLARARRFADAYRAVDQDRRCRVIGRFGSRLEHAVHIDGATTTLREYPQVRKGKSVGERLLVEELVGSHREPFHSVDIS